MTRYPGAIDTNQDLPIVIDNVTEVSGDAINALVAAVIALEKAIGKNPHGSTLDLTSRLSNAINDDGTIKAAALAAAGLVTLPINNSQIAGSAGISESKLDLDIGTTSLQTQVSSNDIDIANLQDALADLILRMSRHVLGVTERHDGYQIDVVGGLPSAPLVTTVGQALAFLQTNFLAHKSSGIVGQHFASAITYIPAVNGIIVSNNVQGAIGEIDSGLLADRIRHNDTAHSNGVSKTGYVASSGQAAVYDAAAQLTILKPSSGPDTVRLGHINAPVVKSRGCNAQGLNSATADTISFSVNIGALGFRILTITGLSTASYFGELNTRAVVNYLNSKFEDAINNYPLTAFESDDGEILIQHNIDNQTSVLTVTGGNAVSTLGLSAVLNVSSLKVDNNVVMINGSPSYSLETIATGMINKAVTSTVLDLGQDVGLTGLNLQVEALFHIYDHTSNLSNGSYRITAVSSSPNTTISVAAAIDAGVFNYVIYNDIVIIPPGLNGANPKTLDFYIDDTLQPSASIRGETTFIQFNQVKLIELSQNFPEFNGSLNLTDLGGLTRGLFFTDASLNNGQITTFTSGYRGYLRVYGVDNSSYGTVLVDASPPVPPAYPAALQNTTSFYKTATQDDLLFLGTSHYNGAAAIQNPIHKRNAGLSGLTSIGSDFTMGVIERDIANLHSSGIIRGFDIVSSNISAGLLNIVLNGGQAYVSGHSIDFSKQSLTFSVPTSGTYNLFLDSLGRAILKIETEVGYSARDIITKDEFALLHQFVITLPSTIVVTDARFFINNVESRLGLTVDSSEFGSGSFKSLDAANVYAYNYPSGISKTITIYSDIVQDNDIVLASNSTVIINGSATFNGALTLDTNSKLTVLGAFSALDSVALNSRAQLIFENSATIADGLELFLNSNSKVSFGSSATLYSITVLGDNVSILGSKGRPTISFYGTFDGITGSGIGSLSIADLVLEMPRVNKFLINIANSSRLRFSRCTIRQSNTPTFIFSDIGSLNKVGVRLTGTASDILIEDCLFSRLSEGIAADQMTDSIISQCNFEDLGIGLVAAICQRTLILDNSFIRMHYGGIKFSGAANDATGVLVRGNRFSGLFKSNVPNKSTPTPMASVSATRAVVIDDNIISGLENIDNLISITGRGVVISTNAMNSNTTNAAAVKAVQITDTGIFANNTVVNHIGKVLDLTNFTVSANNIDGSGGGVGAIVASASSAVLGCVFSGNIITLSGSLDTVDIERSAVSGNDMAAASFSFTGETPFSSAGSFGISGNIFRTTGSAIDGVTLDNASATQQISFCDNIVHLKALSRGIFANLGIFNISNNSVIMATSAPVIIPTETLQLGDGSTLSNYTVSGNIIETGSNTGIYVKGNNASVTGNMIYGTPGVADIKIETASNVFVFGNRLSSSTADIIQSPADQDNVYISYNKNGLQQYIFSAALSTISSGWSRSVTLPTVMQLNSSSSVGLALSELSGLPVGGKIENVRIYGSTIAPNSITIKLFKRGATTLATTLVGTASGTALTYGQIQISGLTEYVDSNTEYFLAIEHNTPSGTVSVGQVVVDIRV